MVATTHTNGAVNNSPTVNANVVGVQLVSGAPGQAKAVPGAPQTVTAGTPGSFAPNGSTQPANITLMRALFPSQGASWTTGQYVAIGSGNVHWNGSDWATGAKA